MAITLVVSTSKGGGQNGGVTDIIDTSLCNFLAVVISGQFNSTYYPVLSDSFANIWMPLTMCGANGTVTQIFYAANPTVGTGHTFAFGSALPGAGSYPGCIVAGFSGVEATSPFARQGGDLGNSNITNSITPSEDNCLVITSFNNFATDPTTVSSPFTVIELLPLAGGINYSSGAGYVVQTTATAAQATWNPNGNGRYSVSIAVFRPDSSSTLTTTQTQVGTARLSRTNTGTQIGRARIGIVSPAAYPTLFDSDFSEFAIGTAAPYPSSAPSPSYGSLDYLYRGGFGAVVSNSIPGIFGDSVYVDLRGDNLVFPVLPPLTLVQAQSGIDYINLGVPAYQQFSLFQGFQTRGGSDLQNTILSFNSNLNPFAGVQVAQIHVNSDGTISIWGQGIAGPTSDYSLMIAAWYWMQVNIAFFSSGANVAFTCSVAINGLVVVSGTLVTTATTTALPVLWINNIVIAPAITSRVTITDNIRAIGDNPHPATSPVVARVSQGVVELILAPQGVYSYAKMKGPVGVSFTN